MDATPHKGTLTQEGRGLWVCTGASRMHNGACPRKRNRWRSQTQTGVSWHHDFRHTTPQRTSEPSVTGLLDTQPLSNDTHSLRRNSWTHKPWDTHPFGPTNLSGTEPSNTPLRFTPLGQVPFGHTNPGCIASSNSQTSETQLSRAQQHPRTLRLIPAHRRHSQDAVQTLARRETHLLHLDPPALTGRRRLRTRAEGRAATGAFRAGGPAPGR